eukprot:2654795-Amphidinium_carterae.1
MGHGLGTLPSASILTEASGVMTGSKEVNTSSCSKPSKSGKTGGDVQRLSGRIETLCQTRKPPRNKQPSGRVIFDAPGEQLQQRAIHDDNAL